MNTNKLMAVAYHRAATLKANAADPYIHEDYKFHEDLCDELLDDLLEECPEIAQDVKRRFMDVLEYDPRFAMNELAKIIEEETQDLMSRLSNLQGEIFWAVQEFDEFEGTTNEIAEWFVNNASAVAHNNYWS